MIPSYLHDQSIIEAFLRRDPYLHLYELGDLDDFFWPYTTWIASQVNGMVQALLLLYAGGGLPVVLAIARPGSELDRLRELIQASLPLLPSRFYAHLSPELVESFSDKYHLEPHGRYLKMGLSNLKQLDEIDTSAVTSFTTSDTEELRRFYDSTYPGNWFDPRMLETGCYFGLRRDGVIAGVAGIHVYSTRYRVATLGNIATHPAYRNQGLGKQVIARLCQHLLNTTNYIGLNVRADNEPALYVYTCLGFTAMAEYDEYMITI